MWTRQLVPYNSVLVSCLTLSIKSIQQKEKMEHCNNIAISNISEI